MRSRDIFAFNASLFNRHRWRTLMLVLCVALGVCAVVLLVSLGESARQYVAREFTTLGSDLLIVLPGKKQTRGGGVPLYGNTNRDLTLDDARAIANLSGVRRVAPIIAGLSEVRYGGRAKEVMLIGSTRAFLQVRQMPLAKGQGLPDDAHSTARAVAVLGDSLKRSLFGAQTAIGKVITIDDYRYRVSGVLAPRGESLGVDLGNLVLLPVKSAEALFNTQALFRVLVEVYPRAAPQGLIDRIYALLKARHQHEEDVTVITQQSIVQAFNRIMWTLTSVVTLLASISLLVAGILIMNLSLISVQQRRREIGLLMALGATRRLILVLFVSEALMLVTLASVFGLAVAQLLLAIGNQLMPVMQLATPIWAHGAAIAIAMLTALMFSWLPASRAANISPIAVLRK